MESIGIAISTYNRPHVLELTLNYLKKFSLKNNKIIVCDDGSENNNQNKEICEKYDIEYFYYDNLGIAKIKNKCLEKIDYCDHIFLLDDDVFPKKEGWEHVYINTSKNSNNHHLLFMYQNLTGRDHHQKNLDHDNNVSSYNTCGGVIFYIDQMVIQKCGGFNNEFDFYGFEHAEFSKRIHLEGLTPYGQYLTPSNAYDYICSIDYNLTTDGKIFLDVINYKDEIKINFSSSIETNEFKKENKNNSINKNSIIWNQQNNIYQNYKI
jgi:glycosyltransferase involved in cell wall biosynthesis